MTTTLTNLNLYDSVVAQRQVLTSNGTFAQCLVGLWSAGTYTLDASITPSVVTAVETQFNTQFFPPPTPTTPLPPLNSANVNQKILDVKAAGPAKSFATCLAEVLLGAYTLDATLTTVTWSIFEANFKLLYPTGTPPPPPTLTFSNIFDKIVAYRLANAETDPVPTFDQCLVAVYNDRTLLKDPSLSSVSYSFLAASFKLRFSAQSTVDDLNLSDIKKIFTPDFESTTDTTTPLPTNTCTCACCQMMQP